MLRQTVGRVLSTVLLCLCSALTTAETKVYFIHNDHLGTPQVMTDARQRVVWKADYLPFGEAVVDEDPDGDGVAVEMPLRFPGQYIDKETGLHYNYYRDYDPSLGRYIQSDPIGLDGGLNTYSYVYNNPLIYIDPEGLAGALIVPRPLIIPRPHVAPRPAEPLRPPAPAHTERHHERERGKTDPYTAPRINPGRGPDGKCKPCPNPPPPWKGEGSAHGSTCEEHWHWIEYNQNPRTCECFPIRRSGHTPPFV